MRSALSQSLFLNLLLAVGYVVLPLLGQGPTPGKKYALLVSVKEYDHSKFPDLKYTENDVEDLARLLKKPGSGFHEVVLLTTTRGQADGKAAPTAKNIRLKLKHLVENAKKHDLILVALAGHGVQLQVEVARGTEKSEAFFCPSDARLKTTKNRKELNETLISLAEVFQQLGDSGAGVKLLLVDACRDDPKEGRNVDIDLIPRPPRGSAALFSCASGQRAFETNKLGKKGHGVFFHFVLEGLGGKAKNEDNEVTWDELAVYVKRQVSRTVPRVIGGGARQSPHLVADLVGEPPVLLKVGADEKIERTPALAKKIKNSIQMQFALIPAGKFTMGSPTYETGRTPEEAPHPVEITRPFYLGVFEVTQDQYREVMKRNPSYFAKGGAGEDEIKGDTGSFPVDSVTWENAHDFCLKLSGTAAEKRAGRTYRLPSEAEWEYACRGGAKEATEFHFGDFLSPQQANFAGKLGRTAAVGSFKKPNAFGLYDMHGNVSEWCADRYERAYYDRSPRQNPPGAATGERRVLRGGSWESPAKECRSAARRGIDASLRNVGFGFRVVCVPAPAKP